MKLLRGTFNSFIRSKFTQNVALVASGTASAQAINMAFSPIITRIYGPEAFGLLGTFMAIFAVITPLAALAYPLAIVLPKDDKDAIGLVKLCMLLSFAMATLIAGLLSIEADWLIPILSAQIVSDFLYIIPLAMLFSAWYQIVQHWFIRKKEFGMLARITVTQTLIINIARTGFGWFNPVGAILILIATTGNALHAAMLFFGARKIYRLQVEEVEQLKSISIMALAMRYHDFPLFRAPQNLINAASQALPILMLASFFGPTAAGFYTLAIMVVGMPSGLIGQAFADVFYPKITEAVINGENLILQLFNATLVLLAIGIIPFGFVVVFGPSLFFFIFGPEWVIAGDYARWLAPFFLFNLVNKPCVAAVPILGLQRGLLVYEIFSTGSKVLVLFIGFYWFKSDIVAVALFSMSGVIAYLIMIIWIFINAFNRSSIAKTSR